MIGASLLDGFGLGAFGEVGVGETLREAVALLFGGGRAFGEASLFGFQVDVLGERERIGHSAHHDLRRAGRRCVRRPKRN